MITTMGVTALVLAAGAALAQSNPDQTQLSGAPPPATHRGAVGKVTEIERHPDMVTMLKLDNGTALTVPPEAAGPGEPAKVGDSVVARYRDNGRENMATLVRVIEMQAP
jgi:hypothetical protein